MIYHLFEWLNSNYDLPGLGLFKYITFRAAFATILSLTITTVFGKKLIQLLKDRQVRETVRKLGLDGEEAKQGTPSMGGIIINAAILIPTMLFANLTNVYIQLLLLTTVWLGTIGFIDDYIKIFKKKKAGLAGKFKVFGQVALGLVVGCILYFHQDVTIREHFTEDEVAQFELNKTELEKVEHRGITYYVREGKSTRTTIPFVKDHEFDYAIPLRFFGLDFKKWSWLIFIPFVILIITAVSNGANLTDGMDGLASGTSAIIMIVLGLLAYLSGSFLFAQYLHILFIPYLGELLIFAGAFVGATIGFLWYNSYPAQIFMGDTGSLSIGGIIAVFGIMIRKELLLPLLCGVFVLENLSVIIQVAWFKYTRKKSGEGKRIFLMAPLHHHYHKKGIHEAKIVTRFWIVGILLAVLTLITLKIR